MAAADEVAGHYGARMTRLRHLATLTVAAVVLAGCGNDPEPAAAPATPRPAATSGAPAPTSSVDEKRGCRAFVALDERSAPTAYRDAGALAAETSVASIKAAGVDLIDAANAAVADPGPASRLALDQASLKMAQACGDEFGNGPW